MTESPEQQPPSDPSPPPAAATPPPPPPPAYGQSQAPPTAYGQPSAPAYGQPPQPGGFAPPPPAGWAPGMAPMMSEGDVKLWSGAAWWGSFILGFIAPLVVMLTKGNDNPFVRRQAVESLNFQLTALIAEIVSAVLILALIGLLLLPVVAIFHVVITIIGAIKATNGEDYRAPINIRMVS